MRLDLLNTLIDQYKAYLRTQGTAELYKYQSLQTFRDNWDIETLDFKSMYARSFENRLTNVLWEGRDFYPKKAMLELIDRDAELVRSMFRELFEEKLDVEGRVGRFLFHCDQLRDDIMRTTPRYQNHYHGDYRMISVYLSFQYPEQYCLYDFNKWQRFMEAIRAKPVPEMHDTTRFFKVMRTIDKLARKDEELVELEEELLAGQEGVFRGESLLLVGGVYQLGIKN